MPYDAGLTARVAELLEQIGERRVRQKSVFSGRGFLVGRLTFAIVWHDDLIVKTPRDEYDTLLREPGTRPFTPGGGRPMGSWVVVDSEAIADDPELLEWLRRGLRAVR